MNPRASSLALSPSRPSYGIFKDHFPTVADDLVDPVTIVVSHSILRAVKITSHDYLFLVMGTDNKDKRVVALSDKQSSIIHVEAARTVHQPLANTKGKKMLVALYEQLLVQSILRDLCPNDTLVVLDVAESMRGALNRRCREKGVVLSVLSTSRLSRTKHVTCTYSHESRRSIRSKLPSKISRFVTMSTDDTTAGEILCCLPHRCYSLLPSTPLQCHDLGLIDRRSLTYHES